jgi:hypothetical protein
MMSNARINLRRKQSQSECEPDTIDSGTARPTIKNNEDQSKRGDRAMGETDRREARSEGTGGILNQLRRLQEEHLEYVDAHGQRLQQRLQENREHRQKIVKEMKALEDELLRLLDEENEVTKSLIDLE